MVNQMKQIETNACSAPSGGLKTSAGLDKLIGVFDRFDFIVEFDLSIDLNETNIISKRWLIVALVE